MGSGVSSVRFIWCGAVLWRYGDTFLFMNITLVSMNFTFFSMISTFFL